MRLSHWLRSLTAPLTGPRARRVRQRPTFRPRLEGLEDRSLPSAVGFSTALPYSASATAVDPAGNVAVSTASAVYRFSPSGQLLASKASVPGEGGGIAVDAAGDVYLNKLGVITELDPTLQQTLFSVTLPGAQSSGFGGPGPGTSADGAIAVAGGKIVAVGAAGAGLPTTPTAYQAAFPGAATGLLSAYVAVIDPTSSAPYHLTYCTYLGGATLAAHNSGMSKGASASGVAVDAAGAVYLTGSTDAADFPITAGAFQTVNHGGANGHTNGGWTSYVAKVDPAQSGAASLVYATFLGGSGYDGYVTDAAALSTQSSGSAIAVDAAGHAYVTGSTTSADFPVTAGAFQTTYTSVPSYGLNANLQFGHAYVTELSPDGGHLVFSTLLGGSGGDWGGGIAVDAAGNVWVTGATRSADFPVTAGAIQPQKTSGNHGTLPIANAFVVELDPTGSQEQYGTFWGGTADNFGMGIGLDGSGDVIVAGLISGSGTYPTTHGAYQKSGSGFLLTFHP